MNNDQIEMVLSESGLDLGALLERAVARRNEQIRLETERLRQEREAQKAAAEEEVALAYRVYQGAVKDALQATIARRAETPLFRPNETELALANEEIDFDSSLVNSHSWRFFSEYHTNRIQKARRSLTSARAKLRQISG